MHKSGSGGPHLSGTHHKGCGKRGKRREEQCIGGGCRRFITTNTMEGGEGRSKGGHGGSTGIGATDFLYMRQVCYVRTVK